MKSLITRLSVLFFFAIISTGVSAQEWTKAQQEVWKTVEAEWNLWKTGDLDGMTAILHEKYQGWNNEEPLPINKATVIEHFSQMKEAFTVQSMSINPARIVVTENASVVDYYFTFSYAFGTTVEQKKGRIVEFYTKEGGKWLLLGDMMVFEDEEDD